MRPPRLPAALQHLRRAAMSSLSSSSSPAAAAPPAHVASALRRAQAVCFDVDSTVVRVEGIDELAAFHGKGAAVAALTRGAMGGSVPFREALRARLALIAPTRASLAAFLAAHPPAAQLSPGVARLVAALHARGTHVFLVSGGFRQMIAPVAEALGVPPERVFANSILFKDAEDAEGAGEGAGEGEGAGADEGAGAYAGFDEREPTSRDGGKADVVRALVAARGYAPVVVVGDGVTDMQARPPADAFVGYGGVVAREAVERGADWFVRDFADVLAVVEAGAREGVAIEPIAQAQAQAQARAQ
jgi:phosphoserine phosphatase